MKHLSLPFAAALCLSTASATTVLHHRFDNDPGAGAGNTATSITDGSGFGNSGSPTGSPVYSGSVFGSPVPQTLSTNGISLDLERGGTQSYTVADSASLDFGAGSAFTIEGWVRLETLGSGTDSTSRQYLAIKKSGANADSQLNYAFLVSTGSIPGGNGSGRQLALQLGNGAGFSTTFSSLVIGDTDWHYVAARFDDATDMVRFTLDGQHQTINGVTQAIAANALNLLVGAHTNGSGSVDASFDGRIDELRISDVFLADGELLNVPEPAAASLGALGLCLLAGRRRRV